MTGLFLDLILGFGIGLSLGSLGGGGSILTVPALVYLVGQSPPAAITTSLVIVGANSLLGASFHYARATFILVLAVGSWEQRAGVMQGLRKLIDVNFPNWNLDKYEPWQDGIIMIGLDNGAFVGSGNGVFRRS
jgi:hypothetical protein